MDSKYASVAYPDNTYLHAEDDESEMCGTGVYPGISVISRSREDKPIKIACIKVKRKFRTLLMAVSVVVVLLIITVIIASSASGHGNDDANEKLQQQIIAKYDTNNKPYGLFYQPQIGHSSLIKYSPSQFTTIKSYLNMLDFCVDEYSSVQNSGPEYVHCADNTPPPDGKICKQTFESFGSECSHLEDYGYTQARPCILLQLRLPADFIPVPFKNGSEVQEKLKDAWSPNHVAVTCDGLSDQDKHYIGNFTYSTTADREPPIQFLPKYGFPLSFFPKKSPKYINPGVMVHFNTVMTNHVINIKCVAWAENFNGGKPEDSKMYTAKFQFLIG